jgi:hypothetical protein
MFRANCIQAEFQIEVSRHLAVILQSLIPIGFDIARGKRNSANLDILCRAEELHPKRVPTNRFRYASLFNDQ